jgi:peptide/nickel transport system ATP-binding protein
VRLIDPESGEIRLNGRDLACLTREEMRAETRHIQMVFQDPFASLNPRRKAGELVAQGLIVHGTARARRWPRQGAVRAGRARSGSDRPLPA